MLFYSNKKYPEEGADKLYLAEVRSKAQRISEITFNGSPNGLQVGVSFKSEMSCFGGLTQVLLNFFPAQNLMVGFLE
jgi:hypothetical protein